MLTTLDPVYDELQQISSFLSFSTANVLWILLFCLLALLLAPSPLDFLSTFVPCSVVKCFLLRTFQIRLFLQDFLVSSLDIVFTYP